jgi:hypothetical protein
VPVLCRTSPDLGGAVTRMVRVTCIIFAALVFTFVFAPRLVALDHRAGLLDEPNIDRGARGVLDRLLDLRLRERIAIRRVGNHLLSRLHQRARRGEAGTN